MFYIPRVWTSFLKKTSKKVVFRQNNISGKGKLTTQCKVNKNKSFENEYRRFELFSRSDTLLKNKESRN